MKVLVYLEEEALDPKGGPNAVGFFYKKEIDKHKDKSIEFLHSGTQSKKKTVDKGISNFPKWLNNLLYAIRKVIATKRILFGSKRAPYIDLSKYDIVHFHETLQMWLLRDQLAEYKGLVLLQSHTPVPSAQEISDGMPKLSKVLMPNCQKDYERVDRYAFDRADYIIFPCKEAEEPYELLWPYYKEIQKRRCSSYRYILTGIKECTPKRDRNTVRRELSIPENDFVISYIGRHNKVKGFDLLKDISQKLYKEDKCIWTISAGNETPIKRLEHPQWREIGFTNDAHSYINASDIFILPNRMTYFDIVMLEVLSLGKVVVASRTGGNSFFEKQGVKGVFLYNTVMEAVQVIKQLKNLPKQELERLGNENRQFFITNLSSHSMYTRYKNLLEDLTSQKQ